VLILVPCHDDAEALDKSLPSLSAAFSRAADRLIVIADRCSDATTAVARRRGVEVLERSDETGGAGKGGALRFALDRTGPGRLATEAVAVFDADSTPSPDFASAADRAFAGGARALQAYVEPVAGRALVSRIAAYSEIISQRISDRLRELLGWSIPLRGTGMVVERGLLSSALSRCRTEVEDLELTLLIASEGVSIRRLAASVKDPKPERASGVVAQRARWLAGNISALRVRRREILRLLRSPAGATLVLGLFCRPRSLLTFLRIAALAAAWWFLPGRFGAVILAALAGFLARDAVLLFGGLFVVDRPAYYLPAVLAAPIYPLVWLVTAVKARRAAGAWLSARRPV
jgi:cellulose synthase/poly-beta-1,6-N-acetylglucosamine synthase-like glycosyltransferase